MARWDTERWTQNEDGSYTRTAGEDMEVLVSLDAEETTEDDGYESMTKPELQAELEERGLPTSGNKPELIERLEAEPA